MTTALPMPQLLQPGDGYAPSDARRPAVTDRFIVMDEQTGVGQWLYGSARELTGEAEKKPIPAQRVAVLTGLMRQRHLL